MMYLKLISIPCGKQVSSGNQVDHDVYEYSGLQQVLEGLIIHCKESIGPKEKLSDFPYLELAVKNLEKTLTDYKNRYKDEDEV